MDIVRRVVARFVAAAELSVGKTYFSGTLKVHRYRDHLRLTDMENAGKRGKKVLEMSISPSYKFNDADGQEWLDAIADQVVRFTSYQQAKAYVLKLQAQDTEAMKLYESTMRGVDVEPMGTKMTLKTNTGLEITISPQDFRVLNRTPLNHPKTGEPVGFQDTNYWPNKKQDGAIFYAWAKGNLSKLHSMNMQDLRELWHQLGIRYDSH